MKARSYFGQGPFVFATFCGLVAFAAGSETAFADPPVPDLPRQFRAEGQPPQGSFLFRGHDPIEPPYEDAKGTFVTIESLVAPSRDPIAESAQLGIHRIGTTEKAAIQPAATPTLTLDRARRAQELATTPRSAKRAVGWSFAPLGLFLGGLGIAAAVGEFDPGRNRVLLADGKPPRDIATRAAAGTTFIALGIPMLCVGVWALFSPDAVQKDASGRFVARETIPITDGLGLGPRGLVF